MCRDLGAARLPFHPGFVAALLGQASGWWVGSRDGIQHKQAGDVGWREEAVPCLFGWKRGGERQDIARMAQGLGWILFVGFHRIL